MPDIDYMGVLNAKNKKERKKVYLDLLAATNDTLEDARRIAQELQVVRICTSTDLARSVSLSAGLRHFIALGERVEDQTHRRVVFEESVPVGEKLVSIFEEHTDIIIKDRREVLYGHKFCLATGASGLVLDVQVLDGNPADSTLAVDMIEREVKRQGQAPEQVAFDGGFCSKANLKAIKDLGVEDVCFSKGRGLAITDMVSSKAVYKELRNFRAGVEAGISFLKRCFGLGRCTWSGLASFKAYVWASALSANLLMLGRHVLAAMT